MDLQLASVTRALATDPSILSSPRPRLWTFQDLIADHLTLVLSQASLLLQKDTRSTKSPARLIARRKRASSIFPTLHLRRIQDWPTAPASIGDASLSDEILPIN